MKHEVLIKRGKQVWWFGVALSFAGLVLLGLDRFVGILGGGYVPFLILGLAVLFHWLGMRHADEVLHEHEQRSQGEKA